MSLLGGLGHWLRNEADNIGGLVTGQPAHGPSPQPQAQQPQQQLPAFHPSTPAGQLMLQRIGGSNPQDPNQANPFNSPQLKPPPQLHPPVPHPNLLHQGLNLGNNLAASAGGFIDTPLRAGALGVANLTHNPLAAQNARNVLFEDTAFAKPAGNIISGAAYNPTADRRFEQSATGTANTISDAYAHKFGVDSNNPVLRDLINEPIKQGTLNQERQSYLNSTGINANDSKSAVFRKGVAATVSAGSPALYALGPASGVAEGLTGRLAKTAAGLGLRAASNDAERSAMLKLAAITSKFGPKIDTGANALKFGAANAGVSAGTTLGQDNVKPKDVLKSAAEGFVGGAALPVAGHLAGAGVKAFNEMPKNDIGAVGKNVNKPNVPEVLKHYTDPEIAKQLQGGEAFDYTKDPIHGQGNLAAGETTGKLVNDGKPALYLSKNDKAWSVANVPKANPEVVNIDHVTPQMMEQGYMQKNGITPQYDHASQKWVGYKNAFDTKKLTGVDYHVHPDARRLVIDSPQKLKQVADSLGTHADDPKFWSQLRNNFDVVDITNVDKNKAIEGYGRKFFKAAKADQSIVLNPEVASTKPFTAPKPVTQPTQGAKGVVISESKPNVPGAPTYQKVMIKEKGQPIRIETREKPYDMNQGPPEFLKPSADYVPREDTPIRDVPNEPIKLTREERAGIIKENPYQEPTTKIQLKTGEGNVKGAIAEAVGTVRDERNKYELADRLQHKLSTEDKNLLYRYDNGEDLQTLAKEAHNPEQFLKAAQAAADALDYSLGVDRSAGGLTLRQKNYIPHTYQADPKTMDELGIPEDQRFQHGLYSGFHDKSAKYPSYLEAQKQTGGLLKPLHSNPFDSILDYGHGAANAHEGQLLKEALRRAVPNEVGELGEASVGGKRLHAAPGDLPFSATDRVMKELNGYREKAYINNLALRYAGKAFDKVNGLQKKLLFSLAWFHQVNISLKVMAATVGSGHPALFARGLGEAIASGIHPKIAAALDRKYLTDGTAEWQRENGVMHGVQQSRYRTSSADGLRQKVAIANERFNPLDMMHRSMGNFINAYANVLSQFAKDHVPSGTPEATALAQEYNALLGHIDLKISNIGPNIGDIVRRGGLAPQFLMSQGKILKDAMVGTKGAKYAKTGIGLTNANDVARTAVIGNRVINTAIAASVSYIASGQMPTFQNLLQRGGFTGGYTGPNYDAGEKDKNKGKKQIEYLPTDYAGLFENLLKDPQHFAASRYSPVVSAITKYATNTDWNGKQLADPNSPTYQKDKLLGAAKGTLPIGVQNLTNSKLSNTQKVEQEFGTRAHDDPNDPQVKATKAYFDTQKQLLDALKKGDFSKIDPQFKDLEPKYANELARKYAAMHPSDNKDITGTSLPRMYDPHTAGERRNNYTIVDKNGNQQLSPLFYIDKKLASLDPTRPHSPLFDLEGTSVDPDNFNKQIPKSRIALNYSAAKNEDPAEAAVMLERDPWLLDYSKAARLEAANYVPTMTSYMQKEGWTQPAIDDYWKKHPQSPGPIEDVNIDDNTQNAMNTYENFDDTTQKDEKIAYIKEHPEILSAFDQIAQHTNDIRRAGGQLELKGYPTPNAHVQQILDSLPKGTDKASKKESFNLINNNPDVQDYLADISSHGVEFEGAKARFTGEDVNQKLLKSVYSMGKYDTVKNADGTYSLIAGTTANGTPLASTGQAFTPGKYGSSPTGPASANGTGTVALSGANGHGGRSKYSKRAKAPIIRHKFKKMKIKHHKKPRIFLNKPPSPIKIKNKVNNHPGIKIKSFI